MTQQEPSPEHSLITRDGQVVRLTLVQEYGQLKYSVVWLDDKLSEDQKYEVADTVARIARTMSERYSTAVSQMESAAILGFKIEARPALKKLLFELLDAEEAAKEKTK